MRVLLWIAFFLIPAFLSGCSDKKPVYIISSSSQLQLPFKASEFFGFFDKNELNIQLDSVPTGDSLVRFLNFSKYTVVITDQETAKKIEKLSSKWQQICTVALKKNKNSPINNGKYILLMKDSLLKKQKEAMKVIEGWNYGVDLLKDPAVVKLLSAEGSSYRFLYCGK